jgi:hypothetical protein
MRYIFLIGFSFVICLQSLQGFITMSYWKYNQSEITKKYCENKAKPKLKCNGKCHLAKQLKAQENQDDSSKNSLPKFKKDIEINLIHQSIESLTFSKVDFSTIRQSQFFMVNNYAYNSVNDCFHPPKYQFV